MTRWFLIRHAPIEQAWSGRIVGRTDVGIESGADGTQLLRSLPPRATWVVSSLRRTSQTAAALGGRDWQVVPALAEQDHGDWEGERWSDLLAIDPRAPEYLATYDRTRPPGGESLEDVRDRCIPAFTAISRQANASDVVAVLHAGPIRCILATVLDMPLSSALKLSVAPLSLTLLEGSCDQGWQVVTVNQVFARKLG
ncbi:MAG: histidine phosphatase family protein [Candidatus Sericytochromatia bacterium]|uniref:Histidine phosphatase family protein n=1 Tax=Candidatus Tanganyikabacteria bacterium TaxID=2961651 RepID=A0A937X1L7_9BACT|nr:histidine phosphatase family protein [Candidatus Tanganyikabacteria bacterium]